MTLTPLTPAAVERLASAVAAASERAPLLIPEARIAEEVRRILRADTSLTMADAEIMARNAIADRDAGTRAPGRGAPEPRSPRAGVRETHF